MDGQIPGNVSGKIGLKKWVAWGWDTERVRCRERGLGGIAGRGACAFAWREGRSRRWELMSTGLGCVVATAGDQDVVGRRGFVVVGLWWVSSAV